MRIVILLIRIVILATFVLAACSNGPLNMYNTLIHINGG